jgi:hypothetical protein
MGTGNGRQHLDGADGLHEPFALVTKQNISYLYD